jgi:transposase
VISESERQLLEGYALQDSPADQTNQLALRARIVLAASKGLSNKEIAEKLHSRRRIVGQWRLRFLRDGIDGLRTEAKPAGRRPVARRKHEKRILEVTKNVRPPHGNRWSCRTLASYLGLSASLVQRVWRSAGIVPHLTQECHSSPPFRRNEPLRLLGAFFRQGQAAIAVEVGFASAKLSASPLVPVMIYDPIDSKSAFAGSPVRQARVLADQQLCFLVEVDKLARTNSRIRLITGGPEGFALPRIRRWLARSVRFTVHYSPESRDFLLDAESSLQRFIQERFARSIDRNLTSLAAPESLPTLSTLDAAFDLSNLGISLPALASLSVPAPR